MKEQNNELRQIHEQPPVRLCPVCGKTPKIVFVGGNASKGNMRFAVKCCSLEFFGAQNFLAYMARESAIYNWNYCIDKM